MIQLQNVKKLNFFFKKGLTLTLSASLLDMSEESW